MKSNICIFLLAIGLSMTVANTYAQVVTKSSDTATVKPKPPIPKVKPKGPKQISSEVSGGLRLNSNGWSLYCDLGKVKSKTPKQSDMFHNVRIYQFEFTEKKNPKEYKSSSSSGAGQGNYIYGKINNFYALKMGIGYRKMLAGKPDPGTVSIHWVNVIGLSVGFLKPYYLNVSGDPSAIKYKDPQKGEFLSQDRIESNAGFGKGLNEVSFVPGGHFKSAVHFDFSSNKKNVIAVETGVNIEYYSQPIALMAAVTPKPYFADLFIGVQFGKRK